MKVYSGEQFMCMLLTYITITHFGNWTMRTCEWQNNCALRKCVASRDNYSI